MPPIAEGKHDIRGRVIQVQPLVRSLATVRITIARGRAHGVPDDADGYLELPNHRSVPLKVDHVDGDTCTAIVLADLIYIKGYGEAVINPSKKK